MTSQTEWKLVPVELTKEMYEAADYEMTPMDQATWDAMLAAAPEPPAPTDDMIRAFSKASDGFDVEKGSFLWEQIERGLIAALKGAKP